MKQPRKTFQGVLHLVLIGTAATSISACSPSATDTRQPLNRARYASLQDCQKDWSDVKDCETVREGGTTYYRSPYYSGSSGKVYHYDGRETNRMTPPTRSHGVIKDTLSPREVYATRGPYADTPAHANAGSAKSAAATARSGGFGGTGRSVLSAGG